MVSLCTEEDCSNKHYGHGKCYKHYLKDPEIKAAKADRVKSGKGKVQCSVIENGVQCDHHRSGKKIYCDKHYRRFLRNPDKDPSTTESRESINKKISDGLTGRQLTEEHKDNLSKGQLKTYQNGRVSNRLGVKLPQEQKDSHSAKMKGRSTWIMDNPIVSDATKQLIREKKTGSKDSEEAKLNKKIAHNRPDKLEESRLIGIATNADPIKKAKHSASLKKTYSTPEGRVIQFERGKKAKNNPIPKSTELPTMKILEEAGIRFGHNEHVHMADHKKYGLRPTKKIDFLIKPNKIIEVNGSYPHADNREHNAESLIRNHGKMIPAKEIWAKEELQLNQIRKNNYRILVIWEMDLAKDYENTKKRIIDFALSKS